MSCNNQTFPNSKDSVFLWWVVVVVVEHFILSLFFMYLKKRAAEWHR